MVVIFPNVCLWRRSLCSNLAGIDPEKLYRAIYASTTYVVASALVSVRLFCKNLGNLKKFLGKWFTAPPPPPWQKIARTPMLNGITVLPFFSLNAVPYQSIEIGKT